MRTCHTAVPLNPLAEDSSTDKLQAGRPAISLWGPAADVELWRSSASAISHVIITDCPSLAPFHRRWPDISGFL